MINSAVKRSLSQTSPEFAWIDSGRNVGFDGFTLNRFHVVGDRFVLQPGMVVEVCETFAAFDFNTGKPVSCYHILPVCRHCRKVLSLQDINHYRGRFDDYCINTPR